jgi:hypothetical protein
MGIDFLLEPGLELAAMTSVNEESMWDPAFLFWMQNILDSE